MHYQLNAAIPKKISAESVAAAGTVITHAATMVRKCERLTNLRYLISLCMDCSFGTAFEAVVFETTFFLILLLRIKYSL